MTVERIDYREMLRLQQEFYRRLDQVKFRKFTLLPNGDINPTEATDVLREFGIDNATIEGCPGNFRIEPT